MRIKSLLDPSHVLRVEPAASKTELLAALAARLAQLDGLGGGEEIAQRLLRREAQTSTGIGSGVAIPHCSLSGLDRPHLLFAACPRGMDYDALDGEPVHILFLVLAPEDRPSDYLKLLARISRLLHDPAFRQRLIAAGDTAELLRLLIEEDDRHP